jgi:hypothetical protein
VQPFCQGVDQGVVGADSTRDEVFDEEALMPQAGGELGVFGRLGVARVTHARVDVHERGALADRAGDGLLCEDEPLRQGQRHLHEPVGAREVRRPVAVFTREERMDDGLVDGCVVGDERPVSIGETLGVFGDVLRVVGVGELPLEPRGRAVVQQVHERPDAVRLHALDRAVDEAPVPDTGLGRHPVPRHTPAQHLGAHRGGEREVGVVLLVVLGQLVFVDGSFTLARLGHEGVLDAEGEVQRTVGEPRGGGSTGGGDRSGSSAGRGRVRHGTHFRPVVATLSMKRRWTNRNMMASGSTAMSEPAIMTP